MRMYVISAILWIFAIVASGFVTIGYFIGLINALKDRSKQSIKLFIFMCINGVICAADIYWFCLWL